MNSDGSYNSTTKQAAVGGLVRDEDGRIILTFQSFIGNSTILGSELMGILKGLQQCQTSHKDHVEVESDSQVAIQLLNQKNKKIWNWRINSTIEGIHLLASKMNVKFLHTYREGNSAADWLANNSLNLKLSRVTTHIDVPIPVRKIAYTDKNGIPYLRLCKS